MAFGRDERVDGDQQEPASLDRPLAVRLPRGVQEQKPAGEPTTTGRRLLLGTAGKRCPFVRRSEITRLAAVSPTGSLLTCCTALRQRSRQQHGSSSCGEDSTTRNLQLAELLGAPDPQQRLRLTRLLPTARVEAERWWIWLSQDPDPQVRAATITILATTTPDPELQKRLRRMQLEEDNEMVRRKIRQILSRRR